MNIKLTSVSNILNNLNLGLVLAKNEFKRNIISFLIPFPLVFIGLIIRLYSKEPISLEITETFAYFGVLLIMALTYGLQCFSNDNDRKTLDFIISRPISPYLILSIKYFLSLGILLAWYIISLSLIKIDLSQLPLPKGIGIEWFTLLLTVIHGISLFSGILSKGLERFFVAIVLTTVITYVSYFIWSQIFNLYTANYYWLDIPEHQMFFLRTLLPYYLAIISLLLPLAGTLWFLRNRIPLFLFTPGKIIFGIWVLTFGAVLFAQSLFSPVLWPQKTAKYGDWNENAGIVLVAPVDSSFEFSKLDTGKQIKCNLFLSKPGHKPHIFYSGINLLNPRLSPNGKRLFLSENGKINIIEMNNKKTSYISQGTIGSWSENNHEIIYSRLIGTKGLSALYRLNLLTKKNMKLPLAPLHIADLLWDSVKNNLYIVDYKSALHIVDLKTLKIATYSFKDDDKLQIVFGINHPVIRLDPSGENLFWGYHIDRSLKFYLFNLKSRQFTWNEEITNFRIKSGAPIIVKSDCSSFLWMRIDGSFNYQIAIHSLKHHHRNGHADE